MADKLLDEHRHGAIGLPRDPRCPPGDFGQVVWHAAIDLAVEVLDYFRTPLFPPLGAGGDSLAVFHQQRIGQGIGRHFRLVEVRRTRGRRIAVGAATQLGDVQQLHGALVILLAGQCHAGRKARCAGAAGHQRHHRRHRQRCRRQQRPG